MKKKTEFWDKKNPKKTSKKLTPAQKTQAKARAKAAGRPYPNLVDNAAVAKKKGKYWHSALMEVHSRQNLIVLLTVVHILQSSHMLV